MEHLAGYIATGLISLAVGVLLFRLQPKAKLLYWSPHSFRFHLTREEVVLQTDALTVQNVGRKTAENVELIMSSEPDFIQLSPAIPHSEEPTPEGYFLLRIASLGPKEFVTLQLLSYTQVPQFLNLRSDAGSAVPMPFQIQRTYPGWFNALAALLLLAGLGLLLYWLVQIAVFVIQGTDIL